MLRLLQASTGRAENVRNSLRLRIQKRGSVSLQAGVKHPLRGRVTTYSWLTLTSASDKGLY